LTEQSTARAVTRYRRLLSLYPRAFRARFEESMCAAFAAEVETTRGAASRWSLWTVTAVQALMHAAAEWLEVLLRSRRGRFSHPASGAASPSDSRLGRGFGIDLRVATRTLRHRPGYATLVIATLALGIGANATIFNLVNAYLFAPLPFDEADRLVYLRDMVARGGAAAWGYTPPHVPSMRYARDSTGSREWPHTRAEW